MSEKINARRETLRNRHRLLRTAQTILFNGELPAKKQHRTCWCYRHVVTESGMPVFRQLDGSRARLGKVKTCGSVWSCPVCSAKVAEQRRRELTYAMVKHTEAGGHAYLVTFTFPHVISDALAELMTRFQKARQSFQNCKSWKAVMGKDGTAGRVGLVNSLECTYGANGWHPHLHMLVFSNSGSFREGDADEQGRLSSPAIDHFKGEWVRLLEKAGLVDGSSRQWALKYGLDVRGGKGAAEYIAKWGHEQQHGLSGELTTSHAKTGKRETWGARDHYTPFQLLAMAGQGDGHAICAFREFVGEFDGRRMLTWSRGLKDHFGIAEMEDEDAAAELELKLNDEHAVGELHQDQLQVLVRYGRTGDFLAYIAEFGHLDNGQALIDDWVRAAAAQGDPPRSGRILVDRLMITDYSYLHVPEEVA